MKLFHISRDARLEAGKTIELTKYFDITCSDDAMTSVLQGKVNEMFPNGVSSHGNQYYLVGALFNDTSADIEMLFEVIRRYKYPNCLSRFEAFYAVDKESFINMCMRLNCDPNTVKIFEVECDVYEKHDMTLLRRGSNLASTVFADLYWEGKSINIPLYEYLLKPPVKIIKEVDVSYIMNS